jgi:apolipoprotein N-acyltransferase
MKEKALILRIVNHLGLVILSSFLFALSFPNPLVENGLPLLAWLAYIPILVVIHKNNIVPCIGWGAVYGYTAFSLFNYWLSVFHPLAGLIVGSIYMIYLAFVFILFKLAEKYFPKNGYLVQWIIFLAYEYLRTKGFLGYSYGITAYSQWRIIPLIQIARITGVWGVSALVTFPSFWLARVLNDEEKNSNGYAQSKAVGPKNEVLGRPQRFFLTFTQKAKKYCIPLFVWTACLIASFIFGAIASEDFSKYPQARIALIQHNTDPWAPAKALTIRQTHEEYHNDLVVLKKLSNEALAAETPDLVVWPETAFVPRIFWHTTYRDDQPSWLLVKELLEYLSEQEVPFLIGNDDARKDPVKNPNNNDKNRIDYNAALLFKKGKITQIYRKIHLVPFTEHFPYQKQLPFIYRALENADTHFWEKGDELTVFDAGNFTFSTPICFEDTFGDLSRGFVREGADVLVNISNDAWSNSLPAQNQHLSMAVFRCVENYRPMARSTVSGQSCAIDPSGRVTTLAQPFSETWLHVSAPLVSKETLYTHYGDFMGITYCISCIILLIFTIIRGIIKP